ncbi:MAG: hypothetical protein QM755_23760 [Luteolibacter sp.]
MKELIDAGFTPVTALMIVALGGLVKVVLALHRKSEQSREEWHQETRRRVDAMQGHIEECDQDRTNLRSELSAVKEKVGRIERCPKTECPNRLP